MKVKIVLIALMVIGLVGTGSMAFAMGKNVKEDVANETSTEVNTETDTETNTEVAEVQTNDVFIGMVEKTDIGIVLIGATGTYLLEGEGLEEFIGQRVEVTRTLVEGATINTIIVIKAEFAKL